MHTSFYIIILFHAVKGMYEFEGVHYNQNKETGKYYIAVPKNVQYDQHREKQIEWAIDSNQTLKCACPAEDPDRIENLQNSKNSEILFEVNRDPCKCSKKVHHSVGGAGEYCGPAYDSYGVGFSIFNEEKTKGSPTEEIMASLQEMSSSTENVIFLPVIRVCIQKSLNHLFTLTYQSKFVQPQKTQLNLSSFKQSSFDQVKNIEPFYSKEHQYEHFSQILDSDMVNELKDNEIYLVPRQLVREEFMLLDNEKSATLYNFNLIPMWSNLADGWDEILHEIVNVYKQRQPLEKIVVTLSGTHGKYKYSHSFDDTEEFTLYLQSTSENYHIDVPYYYWILHWHNMSGIMMPIFIITHNDYQARQDESKMKKLCQISLCEFLEPGLWQVIRKQENLLVYCCPYIPGVTYNIVETLQLENFFNEQGEFVIRPFDGSN